MATILDFYAGDTVHIDISLKDGDVADDLSNATFHVTLKTSMDDADSAAVLKHVQLIGESALAKDGQTTLVLSSAETQLSAGSYFMDVRRVRSGAPPDIWTIQAGKAKVRQPVLRDVS